MHQMELARRLSREIMSHTFSQRAVVIEIGELLAIDAEELVECLAILGHPGVRVELRDSLVRCDCGYLGKAEIYHRDHHATLFRCPRCHALPAVERGEQLNIRV